MGVRRTLSGRQEARASLAVVPVDGELESFARAATEETVRAFAGLATWLAVSGVPRAATHTPVDLHRLGEASGARYILHGWTEVERDRLRLTSELNEAESGRVLWSDRLDRSDLARLRVDAAARMARTIPPLLLQRELDRSALRPPDMVTAQDLALRAFASIMRPRRDTFAAAGRLLESAEDKAGPQGGTRFARIWWHLMAASQGWPCDPVAAGEASAGLDRHDPAAMALLAHLESVLRRDHAAASAMLDRIRDSAPLCGLAGSLKALTLCFLDEGRDAVAHAEEASAMPALGPDRAWRDHVTALAHYVAGRYGDAVRWARVSAAHHPGLAENLRVLAASLAMLGRLDEAQQTTRQMLMIDPDFRIAAWRARSLLPQDCRDTMAKRLRLAGLPA